MQVLNDLDDFKSHFHFHFFEQKRKKKYIFKKNDK